MTELQNGLNFSIAKKSITIFIFFKNSEMSETLVQFQKLEETFYICLFDYSEHYWIVLRMSTNKSRNLIMK